jgi:hypothetical protein
MTRQVVVTASQRDAARMIVKRSEAKGKTVSNEVRKIAEAPARNPVKTVAPAESSRGATRGPSA